MKLPIVAIVGRPNVGKSTLFNCLTRSRQALVANVAGLTRDRQYGIGKWGNRNYIVIDTGGLIDNAEGIEELMQQQAQTAIEEASIVLLVVDASDGLNVSDEEIAQHLRKLNKPVILVLNKSDRSNPENINAEFLRLGYKQTQSISASHRRGISHLVSQFCDWLPKTELPQEEQPKSITIAIIGKPNVGKSTLINRLTKSNRVLASDLPGTTRDSIKVPFNYDNQEYLLIDTAGVRRRRNVHEILEKFSIIKSIESIQQAHIVLLVIDSSEKLSDQDLNIAAMAIDAGKGLVLTLNKWDSIDKTQQNNLRNDIESRAGFLDFAKRLPISALKGSGINQIMPSVIQAYKACFARLSTTDINQVLQAAITHHTPQSVKKQRVKLRYAHLGGQNPPTIVIHGNSVKYLASSYKSFLEHTFRKAFDLYGTPIRLIFKTNKNPYEGHKSKPTESQQKHKRRLNVNRQKKSK